MCSINNKTNNSIKQIESVLKRILRPVRAAINKPLNNKRFAQSREYLKSLKDIHNGERCFIIGNGPSLKAHDLDKLKNEICFGTNGIYEIFEQTEWRPTYYCAQDYKLIRLIKKDIKNKIDCEKFIGLFDFRMNPSIKDAHYFKMVIDNSDPKVIKFSSDMSECCYEGRTITYSAIQIAVYMGFKEIYLLGVDNNYAISFDENGNIVKQANIKNHFSDNYKLPVIPNTHLKNYAYEAARKYADEHDIKIYNATRGGKLEVFERVDFDTLF